MEKQKQQMTDDSVMTFGKFAGRKLADVPDSYLLWLYENGKCNGGLRDYIEDNFDAIKKNISTIKKW